MGILRKLFVVGVGLWLIPAPPDGVATQSVSAPELFGAAFGAVSDARDFCNRQPLVCRTGGYVVSTLQAKAKYTYRMVNSWAGTSDNTNPAFSQTTAQAGTDAMATGTTAPATATATASASAPDSVSISISDLIKSDL